MAASPPAAIRLPRLLAALDDIVVTAPPGTDVADVRVSALVVDSRAAGPGALFACLRGTAADGHRFAPDAVARGASVLLVEEDVPLATPVVAVRVPDTRRALARVASAFYGHPSRDLKVLGVTGTNGKTTVAGMIRAACDAGGLPAGLLGTVGYQFGDEAFAAPHTTPESVEFQRLLAWLRDRGARAVACEVSSHALEQRGTYATDFAVRAVTKLTHDHLDFHGTFDAYRAAKARFFHRAESGVEDDSVAVLNVADPAGRALAAETDYPLRTVGTPDAQITAEDVVLTAAGTTCVLRHAAGRTPLALHLPAAHNVQNALVAFAAATAIGVAPEDAARGLGSLACVPGRLERVDAGQRFTLVIDYAHSPDALERVLRAVREFTPAGKRVVCVVGCGGDRDRGKRPIMGGLAATLADLAVLTSDNPRTEDPAAILREVAAGIPPGHSVVSLVDRRSAIRHAVGLARAGDTVVIAGKGHEDYQVIGTERIHFDDREEARAALAALGHGAEAAG